MMPLKDRMNGVADMARVKRSVRLFVALLIVLLLIMVMLPLASPVMAFDPPVVWVDDDNCLGPGSGTPLDPFCRIQDGVDAVAEWGTVRVAAGQYYEDVDIRKPVAILGAGWDDCEIYSVLNYAFWIDSDYVNIRGFYISGGGWAGIGMYEADNCNIYYNYIEYNWDGIRMEYSSHNTIRKNRVWGNYSDGIWMYNSPNNLIEDNDIAYNYGSWSCPFMYSWDGNEYVLDSQLLNNAPKQEAEKTDYDSLEWLEPDNGEYLLKLTAELEETVYINKLKLVTIDHLIGTQIIPDKDGNLHTIQSPYTPISAKDLDGAPCLNKVNARDGTYWTSNMENKDFSQSGDLRDGIILRFNKPVDATNAKIVVNYKNTRLPEFIHAHFGRLPEVDPVQHGQLHALLHFLRLKVWNGTEWVSEGSFHNNPGSWVARDNVQSIDVSGISGDKLRIKISSLTGLVLIDSVVVDYTEDETVSTNELSVTIATDNHGSDVVSEILADDSDYLVMEQGDYAYLTFDEPATIPDHGRSYVIKAKGYYDAPAVSPLEGEKPEELMKQFLADSQYAMRYHLEKYRPGHHCGIFIDSESDANVIRSNEIHENYGDGIYSWFADNNSIIDNEIWGNEYSGIYLDYSNSNEIQCNDIYENSLRRTGIYLNNDSWDNVINFNNIFDNLDDGVHNDNSSHWVDATNNWWGDPSGPGGSGPGSGDEVSDYVTYDDWLTELCEECPLYEPPPPSKPPAVGGEVYPINKVALLAPWITLAAAIIAGGIILIRRRVHSYKSAKSSLISRIRASL